MFTVTHDSWMYPDHRSGPKLKRLWAADTSGATHQVPNDPSHRFHRSGRSGQRQVRILAIGPELIGASEKLPNHHAGTHGATGLIDKFFEAPQNPPKLATIGKLQCLAGKLVTGFTHVSASDGPLCSSPIALQLADEMKMAQLQDPAPACGERGDAPDLVGNQRSYALLHGDRNGADALRPVPDLFSTGKKQRIEENRTVLMTGFERHQIQHPRTTLEAKVEPVDQNSQWPWQLHSPGAGYKTKHEPMKTVAQGPLRKTMVITCKVFQRPAIYQNGLQQAGRRSPRMTATPFLPNSPGTLAAAASTTARTEPIDFGPTTPRFRVQRFHARELTALWDLKYGKSQANLV